MATLMVYGIVISDNQKKREEILSLLIGAMALYRTT